MSQNKRLTLFTVLVVGLLLAVACGAQPESASPAAEPTELQPSEVVAKANHEEREEREEHEPETHESEGAHAQGGAKETVLADLKPVNLAEGEQLRVVASTSIIGDLVANVAGDEVDLSVLVPIGADLHTFEPTPSDLATVADAHVIFVIGLNAEEVLQESLQNAGGQAVIVPVSADIEPREFAAVEAPVHEEEDGHSEESNDLHHYGIDPHVWTTPYHAMTMVHNIETTLAGLDPANAEVYKGNAEVYEAELEELDTWVKSQIDTIPAENRELVTDHAVFGYYADRYGLTQVGAVIRGFSTTAEPSARELAELQDAITEYDVPAVFVGATVNPSMSKQVAQDTGKKLLTVYTGSLGPAGSGVETFIEYIEYNTNVFVEGLGP